MRRSRGDSKVAGAPTIRASQTLSELIAATLAHIPTCFGRLVYLARCWSAETGRYEHYGLELDRDPAAVHEALRAAHLRQWSNWLAALSLEQQCGDVVEFLDGLIPRLVIHSWEPSGHPWDVVVPQAAPRAERELFAANFRALLVLLKARFA
jgi:hypothetical protein